MKRTLLYLLPLGTKVKLVANSRKSYKVTVSAKNAYTPALEDETGKVKETSKFTSVYYMPAK